MIHFNNKIFLYEGKEPNNHIIHSKLHALLIFKLKKCIYTKTHSITYALPTTHYGSRVPRILAGLDHNKIYEHSNYKARTYPKQYKIHKILLEPHMSGRGTDDGGRMDEAIKNKSLQGWRAIAQLNSIPWKQQISK